MIGYIIIKETGATPKIAKRLQGRLTRETLAETAANHHVKFMDKHFTVAGGREYGYAPRKGEGLSGAAFWRSYTGQKKKKKGHQRPLEWSGASRTLAKIRDVRANRKRARLIQHARGFNRRHPSSQIRMYEEISTVSTPEQRVAIDFAGRTMQRKYDDIKTTKTTRV